MVVANDSWFAIAAASTSRRTLLVRLRNSLCAMVFTFSSVLRQPQAALADDVFLNLAGAAGDSELQRANHPALPSRRFRHCGHRLAELRVWSQHLGCEMSNTHSQLRAEQLQHR